MPVKLFLKIFFIKKLKIYNPLTKQVSDSSSNRQRHHSVKRQRSQSPQDQDIYVCEDDVIHRKEWPSSGNYNNKDLNEFFVYQLHHNLPKEFRELSFRELKADVKTREIVDAVVESYKRNKHYNISFEPAFQTSMTYRRQYLCK